jgi:hypothetical protein
LTIKQGKFIELRHSGKTTVDQIVEQFHRAINIVEKYPTAEIKFIDCPILSIVKYNTIQGTQRTRNIQSRRLQCYKTGHTT